jgi:hypothetical protein
MNDSIPLVGGTLVLVAGVLLYVWFSLALSALFRKAGEEGWQGWVPYYNIAVLLRLGGFSPWFIFIGFVPIFGAIALYVMFVISCHRITRAFGFGAGMTVLAALVPVVWASILGFGSSRWIGASPAGPLRSGDASASGPSRAPYSVGNAPSPAVVPAPTAGLWAPPPAAASNGGFASRDAAPFEAAAPAVPPLPPPPLVTTGAPRPLASPLGDLEDSAVDPEDRIPRASFPPASFSPPPAPPAPRAAPEPFAPIESVPVAPPAPVADAEPSAPVTRPPAPTAPVTRVPAAAPQPEPDAEPWVPTPSAAQPAPPADPDAFPELSEAVSAVIGAPDAGAPRSARSSVSALYAQPEIPDDVDAIDETIVARRRRIPWALIPPGGTPIDISSEVVILGRRPAPDAGYPGAQLIAISDETRTVSKTHARLELRGDTWFVTDLGSTNGVLFATLMGTEVEAQPGQEIEAGERFFLGDAEVRLKRSEA